MSTRSARCVPATRRRLDRRAGGRWSSGARANALKIATEGVAAWVVTAAGTGREGGRRFRRRFTRRLRPPPPSRLFRLRPADIPACRGWARRGNAALDAALVLRPRRSTGAPDAFAVPRLRREEKKESGFRASEGRSPPVSTRSRDPTLDVGQVVWAAPGWRLNGERRRAARNVDWRAPPAPAG